MSRRPLHHVHTVFKTKIDTAQDDIDVVPMSRKTLSWIASAFALIHLKCLNDDFVDPIAAGDENTASCTGMREEYLHSLGLHRTPAAPTSFCL